MRACIITIGNEILKGKTVNTNAAEIGRMLSFSGYEVFRGMIVPDIKEEIGEAFRTLVGRCDVIVSSGGLGPTFDDITVSSFALEFGIPIVRDEETYRIIERRSRERGLEISPEREKMAMIPSGCTVIKNNVGTAPGVDCRIGNTRVFILPGVPLEMRSMLEYIEERIKLGDSFYYEDSIRVEGIYEATLAPYITELMKKYEGKVYIKSHPMIDENGESELEIEVSAKSSKLDTSRNIVHEVLGDIREISAKILKT